MFYSIFFLFFIHDFFLKVCLDLAEKKDTNEKSHFFQYLEIVSFFWDETSYEIFFYLDVYFAPLLAGLNEQN